MVVIIGFLFQLAAWIIAVLIIRNSYKDLDRKLAKYFSLAFSMMGIIWLTGYSVAMIKLYQFPLI